MIKVYVSQEVVAGALDESTFLKNFFDDLIRIELDLSQNLRKCGIVEACKREVGRRVTAGIG